MRTIEVGHCEVLVTMRKIITTLAVTAVDSDHINIGNIYKINCRFGRLMKRVMMVVFTTTIAGDKSNVTYY